MLHLIEDIKSWEKALKHDGLLVVFITATWCKPCKKMKPWFANLSTSDKLKKCKVDFLSVDSDKLPGVIDFLQVKKVPTFLLLFNGKVLKKITGNNKISIEIAINEFYHVGFVVA
jgi:thioredoxin 1